MAVDPELFKQGLRRWASGVTVVTTKSGDQPHGMTVSAFSSVSADPPLVLVCIDHRAYSHDPLVAAPGFAVHVLGRDGLDTSAQRVLPPLARVPQQLPELLARASDGVVEEVIIATNFTAEGEATSHILAESLKARGVRSTRLARGVPIGSELEYVDLGTIAHALVDRR